MLHRDITDQNIDEVVEAFRSTVQRLWPRPIAGGSAVSVSSLTLQPLRNSTETLLFQSRAIVSNDNVNRPAVSGTERTPERTPPAYIDVIGVSPIDSNHSHSQIVPAQSPPSLGFLSGTDSVVTGAHLYLSAEAVHAEKEKGAESTTDELGSETGTGIEVYHEEVTIHAMSVSENGFCVLLRGLVSDRVLCIPVTPSDPMSDGLDKQQVGR